MYFNSGTNNAYSTFIVKIDVLYDSVGAGFPAAHFDYTTLICDSNDSGNDNIFLSAGYGSTAYWVNQVSIRKSSYNGNDIYAAFTMDESRYQTSSDYYRSGTITITLLYGIKNLTV